MKLFFTNKETRRSTAVLKRTDFRENLKRNMADQGNLCLAFEKAVSEGETCCQHSNRIDDAQLLSKAF